MSFTSLLTSFIVIILPTDIQAVKAQLHLESVARVTEQFTFTHSNIILHLILIFQKHNSMLNSACKDAIQF